MDDLKTINILKGIVIDGVNKANSGHPGGAMSSMDFAYLLFTEYLQFDPDDPSWLGRDRFILSAGHESMLLYTLLFMNGTLQLDDLKAFRQWHSRTPGHPENFLTPGVECTTGPLGQGAAMSVGFAIAAQFHATKIDANLFSQKTWALLGDGCIQEDITYAAASMAGHLRLPNLIWFYDRNRVQISGKVSRSYSDDTETVFRGMGWDVFSVDGHDHKALRRALDQAIGPRSKPLLIIGETTIAKGAHSMEGSASTHGSPLPKDERAATKIKLGLDGQPDFFCPDYAVAHYRRHFTQKRQKAQDWREALAAWRKVPKNDQYFRHCFEKEDLSKIQAIQWNRDKPIATRSAFGQVLEQWADWLPNLMGGSADLEPSNMTGAFAKKVGDFAAGSFGGRNLAFGVREFPMSAICNGMALFGGVIPFDATFLSFADYSRPALRLGAIQRCRVIHEFTHDSFYLGEDGPTHQPVEHLMALRLIPDFYVMRPADALETEVMMTMALKLTKNTAICLSRQNLPHLAQPENVARNAVRGGYVLVDQTDPDYIIFATGSEVHLALDVARALGTSRVKVVSLPCWELFFDQDASYRQSVLTPTCARRISIEAGSTLGWERFIGTDGLSIGRDEYGHSAPSEVLAEHYGFTPEAVLRKIQKKWPT